jgi:hypothetical protein
LLAAAKIGIFQETKRVFLKKLEKFGARAFQMVHFAYFWSL